MTSWAGLPSSLKLLILLMGACIALDSLASDFLWGCNCKGSLPTSAAAQE